MGSVGGPEIFGSGGITPPVCIQCFYPGGYGSLSHKMKDIPAPDFVLEAYKQPLAYKRDTAVKRACAEAASGVPAQPRQPPAQVPGQRSCQAKFTNIKGHAVPILRVGMATTTSQRWVPLIAEITPPKAANGTRVVPGPGVRVRAWQSSLSNSVRLSVTGERPTDENLKNYSWVKVFSGTTECGSQKISVVLPKYVGSPPDSGDTAPTQSTNMLMNKGSSPAWDPTVPNGSAYLVRWYGKWLRVVVKDQFGDPIGDLYEGAPVEETFGNHPPRAINQKLRADSSYADPVGMYVFPAFAAARVGGILFSINSNSAKCWQVVSCASKRWPAQWRPTLGPESVNNTFTVVVDGFKLKPAIQRTVVAVPPDNIRIRSEFVDR
jgi:hypothetical protein